MIQFRIREWGSEDWSYLFIQGPLASGIFSLVGSPLSSCFYHVQLLSDEEEWEDFE